MPFEGCVGIDECRKYRYWNGRQVKLLYDVSKMVERAIIDYRSKHGTRLEDLKKTVNISK